MGQPEPRNVELEHLKTRIRDLMIVTDLRECKHGLFDGIPPKVVRVQDLERILGPE